MGFIGYRRHAEGVRVFLECDDPSELGAVSCTYPVDVIFTESEVRFEGVSDVLALKKFYKLVSSLEERAREKGRHREVVFRSPDDLLEHLRLTRNARELEEDPPRRYSAAAQPPPSL
jgi:hypothetical protein